MRSWMRIAVLVGAALPLRSGSAEPPSATPTPQAVLDRIAPTVVTLKFVWRTPKREVPYATRGTVVDPSGLVLASHEYLGGKDAQVVGLRAIVPGEATERDAVIAARDVDIGLAFVQILGLGAKTLPAIDLRKGTEPRIGQDLLCVWRDDAGFDHAPSLFRCYVTGRVERPRVLWALGGDAAIPGMPVYDEAGRPVGVATREGPVENPREEGTGTRTFLLPLADAIKSIDAARLRVPDAIAKAKEETAAPREPDATPPKEGAPAAPKEEAK